MQKVRDIQRLRAPAEKDFVEAIVRPAIPVILEGAFEKWPARRWDVPYLLDAIGDVDVGFRKTIVTRSFAEQTPEEAAVRTASFREYCRLMDLSLKGEGPPHFLSGDATRIHNGNNLNEPMKKLAADFDIPSFCQGELYHSSGLWVSPRGVRSWLHYDVPANLNMQVTGRKRAILFHPGQVENLSVQAAFAPPFGYTNFFKEDFWAEDLKRFPKSAQARYWEGDMKEGDVLYIPPYWIHGFEHLGDININLNLWWKLTSTFDDMLIVHNSYILSILEKVTVWNKLDTPDDMMLFFASNPRVLKLAAEIEAAILGAKEPPTIPKFNLFQKIALRLMVLRQNLKK